MHKTAYGCAAACRVQIYLRSGGFVQMGELLHTLIAGEDGAPSAAPALDAQGAGLRASCMDDPKPHTADSPIDLS